MLRLIERRALAQLSSTRTFVALGFFPALLAREVARRRYLRLWHAVADGVLPSARKYALISRGPGVDPACQERTYFDCLAAVDTFRENDDLSVPEPEFEDTPLDKLLDQLGDERPPVEHRDEWNAWQERKFAAICQLAGKHPDPAGTWVALYFCGGTRIVNRVSLVLGQSGWLSLPMTVDTVGVNEGDPVAERLARESYDPAVPVVDWEGGVARKARTHEPIPAEDLDFAEVEIKLHQWQTAQAYIDQQVQAQVDVYVEPVQARYEDLVLYTGALVEGHTAALNVGEPIA